MKKANLWLLIIICFYGLIYIATTKHEVCDGDCANITSLRMLFLKDSNYISPLFTCGYINPYDTICVNVKDTTYNSWNVLADSICSAATQLGLPGRHIFIINNFGNVPDTVANKSCP